MTVNGGVAVGLSLFLRVHSVKKSDGVRKQGVSARTVSTRMYRKLWEHVVKTSFKNEIWVQ